MTIVESRARSSDSASYSDNSQLLIMERATPQCGSAGANNTWSQKQRASFESAALRSFQKNYEGSHGYRRTLIIYDHPVCTLRFI